MKTKFQLLIVALCLMIAAGCNASTPQAASPDSTPANSPSAPTAPVGTAAAPVAPVLPPPPAPAQFTGSPDEQAVSFAKALASAPDNASRLAVWLGVYESLGIPVMDEAGKALTKTGDDPAGAPYWNVWYTSGMDLPLRRMTLDDAAKILSVQADGTFDPAGGQTLLADLRAAAHSKDPHVRLLGLFVRERMLSGQLGLDLLKPEVTSADLRIDPATVQMLQWVLTRSVLFEIGKTKEQSNRGGLVLAGFDVPPVALQAAGKPRCAELFGSEDTTAMVNWLANKFYTGLSVPMVGSLPGMTETMLKQVGVATGKIDKLNKFMSRANAIGTLLSLYMQIHSLTVEGEITKPGPLVRTKTTSDGERDGIRWHLFYDKEKTPDGNELWACMTSFVSSTMGVSVSIPPSEGIGGADIIFAPGKNIPEKVLFDSDTTNYRITTDSTGYAVLKLIGKAQKKNIPDSAPPYDDTFSMTVSAQPEGLTGTSLANMFVDSLIVVVKPDAAAAVAPVVDLLKTLHYDLGDYEFLLTDWRVGYTAAGGQGISIAGTICGALTDPFKLEGAVPDGSNVTFSFTPANEKSGSYTYNGSGGGVSFSGSGSYTIAEAAGDTLTLTQTDTRGCVAGAGNACKEYTNTVTLTPAESCKP